MMRGSDHLPLVALGGVAGAGVRWFVGEHAAIGDFPWHTLLVNVVGCALLALILARPRPTHVHRLLAVGFCGGLTTMSTFALDVVELTDSGRVGQAVAYLAASLLLGLGAFVGVRHVLVPGNVEEGPE